MFPDSFPRSAELYQRARRVVADGVSRTTIKLDPHPIYVSHGRGGRLVDVDGHEFLDFNNNFTALIHGHAHPAICRAVEEQLRSGASFSFATEAEVRLAELLCQRVPSFERIRFTNTGTEAVMQALKAARAYTGRAKIAKCEGAYHGSYDYAEVSLDSTPENWGEDRPQSVPYCAGTPQRVLEDVVVIPYNDAGAAEAILDRHRDELAAVLFDPLSSRIGLIPAQPEFARMLRRFTTRNDVVLIFDEVLCLRCGPGGVQGDLGIGPDLTALGKIIGGGFPIGAVAGKASVMAVFEAGDGRAPVPHGGTFNANPVSMVAGFAAMELMTPEAYRRLNALSDRTRQSLRQAVANAEVPAQVTGAGSLFRLHLNQRPLQGYRDVLPSPEERRAMAHLHRHLLAAGVYLATSGLGCLSTATVEVDTDRLAEAVETGLRQIEPL